MSDRGCADRRHGWPYRLLRAAMWCIHLQIVSTCVDSRGVGTERRRSLNSLLADAPYGRMLNTANRICDSKCRTHYEATMGVAVPQTFTHAFVISNNTLRKSFWGYDHAKTNTATLDHQTSRVRGNRYCINASRQFNHGINPDRIIGGDIDRPPGILHSAENSEIREFTQEMWNKGVSIEEAVDRLNLLEGTEPGEVMDNFLYGNCTTMDANKEETGTEALNQAGAVEGDVSMLSQDGETIHENIKDDESQPFDGLTNGGKPGDKKLGEIPGYVAPSEYIDEEQYRRETEEYRKEMYRDPEPDMADSDLEDEHHTGIDEVNYSALRSNELLLVRTLMQNKLDAPESHEQILKELLAGDTGGFTEEQCRAYFDKFIRIGDILMELNKTVGMQPLQLEWIPEMQQRIRNFLANKGYEVESIKWTENDVVVGLKNVMSETSSASIHEALAMYLHTDAGIDLCHGIKNVGLLMYTATPEENQVQKEVSSADKGKSERKSKGRKQREM